MIYLKSQTKTNFFNFKGEREMRFEYFANIFLFFFKFMDSFITFRSHYVTNVGKKSIFKARG